MKHIGVLFMAVVVVVTAGIAHAELIQNQSFENANHGELWTVNSVGFIDTKAHQGVWSAEASGEWGFIYQDVPVIAGQQYTAGAWLYSNGPFGGNGYAIVKIEWDGGQKESEKFNGTPDNQWVYREVTAVIPEGVTSARVTLFKESDTDFVVCHFDDVKIVKK